MTYSHKVSNLSQAHETAVKTILLEGLEITTEDNEQTYELPEPLVINIANPTKLPNYSSAMSFGISSLNSYADQLCNFIPNDLQGFAYTYSARLMDYPTGTSHTGIMIGDGNGEGINQIKYIVDKIKEEKNSRRAVAVLWVPDLDTKSVHPPCLNHLQCILRENRLNMSVVFRSHDILSAYGANIYALAKLQSVISNQLGVIEGWLETHSICPHIYYIRDKSELDNFKRLLRLS